MSVDQKLHPLLELQLRDATNADGEVDITSLLTIIDTTYRTAGEAEITAEMSNIELIKEIEKLVATQRERHTQISIDRNNMRETLNALTDGITYFDERGRLVLANKAFFDIFGLDENASIINQQFHDIVGGTIETELFDDSQFLLDIGFEILQLSAGEILDRSFALHSGKAISTIITKQDNGSWCAIYYDNTEEKSAREKDHDADNRWMFALESAQQGVWDTTLSTGDSFFSHTWLEMRGITNAEYAEHGLLDFKERIHPDDLEKLLRYVQEQNSKGAHDHEIEFREKHKDGHWMWILSRGKPITWDAEGNPLRVIGTDTDITDLKKVQAALVETESRWNFALEGSGQGVWDFDLAEEKLFLSPVYREMRGLEQDTHVVADFDLWLENVHPDDQEKMQRALTVKGADNAKNKFIEYRERHQDGHWIWIERRIMPVSWDEEENPLRLVGVDIDVTIKKQLELQVVQSLQLLNATLENFPTGIGVFDSDLILTVANRKYFEVTGLDEDWFPIGSNWADIIRYHAEQGAYGDVNIDDYVAERVAEAKDPLMHNWNRVTPNDGPILEFKRSMMAQGGFVLTVEDVTDKLKAAKERQELEHELGQAQKMEALGTLASGVAHEINTPVQYIGDNIRFMRDGLTDLVELLDVCLTTLKESPSPEQVTAAITQITEIKEKIDLDFILSELPLSFEQSIQGIKQVASIVNAIKEFSHPGQDQKVDLDLNAAIETTLIVSRNQWKYLAEVETDLAPDLPMICGHSNDLNQVVLNLTVNAAHAIEAKKEDGLGKIIISTRQDGDYAVIKVSDNGCGMSPETLEKIYNPFFTTKDIGKGTGQGLAISFAIITRRHNGTIECESELGKGTTFTIRLPISDEQSLAETAA